MTIVVDANLLVALISGDPRRERVSRTFLQWLEQDTQLHAPLLAQYEVVNALTRLIAAGAFSAERVDEAWSDLSLLPIIYHPVEDAARVVEISLRLGRQSAYDASYLALAESLAAELNTLDEPLYHNALRQGFRVRLV